MKKLLFGVTLCVLVCTAMQGAETKPKKNKKRWSFSRKKKTSKKDVGSTTTVLQYVPWEDFNNLSVELDGFEQQFQELQQQSARSGRYVKKASAILVGVQKMVDELKGEVKSSLESIMSESNTSVQDQAAKLVALTARVQRLEDNGFLFVEKDACSAKLEGENKSLDLESS